jgi:ornithine cyclodeaminase/alanine dehydrogenase-like protein (mu-crystallin family)
MTAPPYFSAQDIYSCLSVKDLIAPLGVAMIAVSEGRATHPPRFAAPVNTAGRMGVMYGGLEDPPLHGAKFLSLYPDAPALGLSSHQGFVLLFDSRDGRPIACFDADGITALRTAAASMLASQVLARANPETITICGAGEQAEWHLRASLECFEDADIRIWARRPEAATALRDRDRISVEPDLEAAIRGADIIHTATAAREAFLCGAVLEAGQHLNLVGASLADSRELDNEGVGRVSMFTDALESSAR